MKISKLPEHIKQRALSNQRDSTICRGYNEATDELIDAFDWSQSPEGDQLWNKVYKGEFSDPLIKALGERIIDNFQIY